MFIAIVQHAPRWVWFLLVALIALGVSLSFPRRVSLRRAILVPAAMVTLSFYGVVSVFAQTPLALVAWAVGVAAALAGARAMRLWQGIAWSPADARVILPGSWVPLLLIVTLFGIKFGVGASLAMNPALAREAGFAAAVGLLYGGFSGVFLARGLAVWQVARQNLQSGLAA